jgi:predicted membrane protein
MNDSNNDYDAWREQRRRKWEERRAQRMARFSHGGVYAGHGGGHSHAVMGITILLLGILFLLSNLGYFYIGNIWQFWPVILIAWGVSCLFDARSLHGVFWGVTVAAIGGLFLASNLGYLPWNVWQLFWPVLLISWGIMILLRSFGGRGHWARPSSLVDGTSTISDNVLKEVVLFGGIHRKVTTQDFQGGEVSATFGGIEIDLREASTTKDVIDIKADALFGGVELKVPDTWDVTVRGDGMLGGFEDKTHPAPVQEGVKRPRLTVRGGAIFGGVTVRN